jgi:hypothetical protein
VLTYTSPAQLADEPEPVKFLHVLILTALRDRAERLEVRFAEGHGLVYYRTEGRDWELTPPPADVYPELKPTLRRIARLVTPERPDVSVVAGQPDAKFEPQEVGWLTYQLGQHLLDMVIRIDPREPWGGVRIELEHPEELAGLAGEALADYLGQLDDTDLE